MSKKIEYPKRLTPKQFHELLRPMGENQELMPKQNSRMSRRHLRCAQDVEKSIISTVTKHLESWFSSGVDYTSEESMLAPGRLYTNMPVALGMALRQAHWLIAFQLLKQNGIPYEMWPSALMLFPSYKKPESETEDYSEKIRPILGIKANLIPGPFVWNTRTIPPSLRAEKVAWDWFGLTQSSWADFLVQRVLTDEDTYYDRSIPAVNRRVALEEKVTRLGYDYFDIMQYYMRKQGFYYRDISGFLGECGIKRSEEAVRKSYKRQEMKIEEE